jgi:hypothetical protein
LNSGATSLAECPRSLKALLPQLNHGAKAIDTAMKITAINGAMMPNRA